jgi:hypothetical protein
VDPLDSTSFARPASWAGSPVARGTAHPETTIAAGHHRDPGHGRASEEDKLVVAQARKIRASCRSRSTWRKCSLVPGLFIPLPAIRS